MNLPLLLTVARILISPIFLVLYLYYDKLGISLLQLPYILMSLFLIIEMTDLFDGYLARKNNQVTDLGKLLDPMADSLFHSSVFFIFTQGIIQLPLLLAFVFLYRDLLITTLRTYYALQGVALGARFSGKMKTLTQASSIFFILILMIPYSWGNLELKLLREISFYAVLAAALYTISSGVEYLRACRAK